jgi:hypothetical protein
MSRARWAVVAAVAMTVAAFACWVRGFPSGFLPDLVANLAGGHLVAVDPAHLYDVEAQRAWENSVTGAPQFLDLFISPPYVAVVFRPLAELPLGAACIVWAIASIVAFVGAFVLARPLADDARIYAFVVIAFAASEPIAETLLSGQTSAVSLLIWIAGVRLVLAKRDFVAGLVLGLGLLKPQLFVLVPIVFAAQRRWRGVAGFSLMALVWLAIGAIAAGPHAYVDWIAILRTRTYLESIRAAHSFQMCSVEAMLRGLLPGSLGAIALPAQALAAVGLTIALFAAAKRMQDARIWAAAILATTVAAPHLVVYDLALLALPAIVMAPRLADHRAARLAFLAAFVLPWAGPILETIARHASWPRSALAAPLLAIPLVVLFVGVTSRRCERRS